VISVVVPTLDRAELLHAALRSLAAQTYADFEVIVVNDGGRSVTRVVNPWQSYFPVTLIELPRWRGVSHARNIGIEHTRGEYIAFLDDDDLFLPGHLAAATAALDAGDVDFVYFGAVVSGRRVTALPPDWHTMHRKAYQFDERFLLVANYLHTGSVVVRNYRDSPVRFDESLSHCEDWDMWLSLRFRLGYRVGFVDEISTIYHQVAGAEGLVSQGQAITPSPFSLARERLYSRWPVDDEQVLTYRKWMTSFDAHCNDEVARGRPVPTQTFDRMLQRLHHDFTRGRDVYPAHVPELFVDR
jgi:glycosyltransferase involved in cell wall biosynthesis